MEEFHVNRKELAEALASTEEFGLALCANGRAVFVKVRPTDNKRTWAGWETGELILAYDPMFLPNVWTDLVQMDMGWGYRITQNGYPEFPADSRRLPCVTDLGGILVIIDD